MNLTWLALIFAVETGMVGTAPNTGWEFVEPQSQGYYAAIDAGVELFGFLEISGMTKYNFSQVVEYNPNQSNTVEYIAWATAEFNGFSVKYQHEFSERQQKGSAHLRYDIRVQ